MKPLNEQERTKQFFIFLGFFIITIVLVIGIAYFPLKYNPKNTLELLEKERAEVKTYGNDRIKSLMEIDSLLSNLRKLEIVKESDFSTLTADVSEQTSKFKSANSEDKFLVRYAAIVQLAIGLSNEKKGLKDSIKQLSKEKADFEKKNTALKVCLTDNDVPCPSGW